MDNTYRCPMYYMNRYVLAYMHVDKSFMHDIHRCGGWVFTGRTVVYCMRGSMQCLKYISRICRDVVGNSLTRNSLCRILALGAEGEV